MSKQLRVIIALQKTRLNTSPKRMEAKEAVTIVTAVCMVNMVAKLSKK